MSNSSPYINDSFNTPPPPKRNNTVWWILGILGATGIVIGVGCCGGFAMLGYWGLQIASKQIEEQIRNEPEIQEHIGNIESFAIDLTDSAAKGGDNEFVYNVKGTKGSGELIVDELDNEQIKSARLRLPDGQEIDVLP